MTPITHRSEIERLERELAESREECRRLQFALTEIGKGYDYLHKYNAPDHKKYTGESLFGQQWSNYEGFDNFIRRVIAALFAPKVGDK